MKHSTLTRPLATALMLVAGVAAAQPPVRSFSTHSFAARPRVIKAELLGEKVPAGVEQVAVPSSYWRSTAQADVTFVRESVGGRTTLHEVNRLPQRLDIRNAVLQRTEPNRMRVTVSLGEERIWLTQGNQKVSVPLEIRGGVRPTQEHVQTLGKVGKALAIEQSRTWRLPEAVILNLENNTYFYKLGDYIYPLHLEKVQGTFEVMYPSPTMTEREPWLLFVAYR